MNRLGLILNEFATENNPPWAGWRRERNWGRTFSLAAHVAERSSVSTRVDLPAGSAGGNGISSKRPRALAASIRPCFLKSLETLIFLDHAHLNP